MTEQNLSRFLRLARNQCASYSDIGPLRIKNYCCSEPRESKLQCRILHNMHCPWFEQAVLPLEPELMREWNRTFGARKAASGSKGWDRYIRCKCGTLFKPASNRQAMCEDCAKKRRKQKQREYRNKNREKVASVSI